MEDLRSETEKEIAARVLAFAEATLREPDGISDDSFKKLLKLFDYLGVGREIVLKAKNVEARWHLD